jgi:hypothetical protein
VDAIGDGGLLEYIMPIYMYMCTMVQAQDLG